MEHSLVHRILSNSVIWIELLTVVVALWYYNSLKSTYWRYFVYYLILIFCNEAFSMWIIDYTTISRKTFYDFYAVPIQFLFLFWLFAKKSLKMPKLFYAFCTIYLLSFFSHFFYLENIRMIHSLSYSIGCLLLFLLLTLEFKKQVFVDDILKFKSNKMFYITIGVLFFYIGSLPFFALDKELYTNHFELWKKYHTWFLADVNFLYITYIVSFIWGKPTK